MDTSPSPAVMPRRRPTAVPTAPGTVTVTMTVDTAAGLFSDDSTTFVACAAVDGVRSPVLAGPRASVLDSAARWVCRSTPFMNALCTPVVQLHSGETADVEDIAVAHADAVRTAFLRAGVTGTTVECHAGADPVTLPVRPVVRGHEPPGEDRPALLGRFAAEGPARTAGTGPGRREPRGGRDRRHSRGE